MRQQWGTASDRVSSNVVHLHNSKMKNQEERQWILKKLRTRGGIER
jgi:hypothetical protein